MSPTELITLLIAAAALACAVPAVVWYKRDRERLYEIADGIKPYLDPESDERAALILGATAALRAEVDRARPIVEEVFNEALERAMERASATLDAKVEQYKPLVADALNQTIEAVSTNFVGGLGAIIGGMAHSYGVEHAQGMRDKGKELKKQRGLMAYASKEIAAQLDPTGGLISQKLLELAEEQGIPPDQALEMGIQLWERLGPRLQPLLEKLNMGAGGPLGASTPSHPSPSAPTKKKGESNWG